MTSGTIDAQSQPSRLPEETPQPAQKKRMSGCMLAVLAVVGVVVVGGGIAYD